MSGYWRQVSSRAIATGRRLTRIDTPFHIGILVVGQIVWACISWWLTPENDLVPRIIAAALPFILVVLLYPLLFVIEIKRWHEELVDRLREADQQMSAMLSEPVPDMPIRDLFLHIDPHVYDKDLTYWAWVPVGLEIRDKLATGRLESWGRLYNHLAPLRPIDASYWEGADWDYQLLGENATQLIHCKTEPEDPSIEEYCDVMVSKQQVNILWPQESVSAI